MLEIIYYVIFDFFKNLSLLFMTLAIVIFYFDNPSILENRKKIVFKRSKWFLFMGILLSIITLVMLIIMIINK
jgi:cell division septal protein FtsQ